MRSVRTRSLHALLALGVAFTPVASATGLLIASSAPAMARTAPESFADLAAKLQPSVVNISSSSTIQARGGDRPGPEIPMFPPGSPFEQFFKDFMERNQRQPGQRNAATLAL